MLSGEASHAAAVAPEIEVSTSLQQNSPVAALLDEGRNAELIVIGNRQRGEFASVSLGSVGLALASHAPCPVVVVRQAEPDVVDGPSSGRIVVGVDESPRSHAALQFALDEARLRHIGLTAVSAWTTPGGIAPHLISHLGFDLKVIEQEQEDLLENRLSDWAGKYPDVDIVRKAPMGHPAHELIRESAGAVLVVVGPRGRGGFRGLLLGSTTHALLHHSPAPVGVIREK
jgi:nucleotide-binding universal stress UspA family protein